MCADRGSVNQLLPWGSHKAGTRLPLRYLGWGELVVVPPRVLCRSVSFIEFYRFGQDP